MERRQRNGASDLLIGGSVGYSVEEISWLLR